MNFTFLSWVVDLHIIAIDSNLWQLIWYPQLFFQTRRVLSIILKATVTLLRELSTQISDLENKRKKL